MASFIQATLWSGETMVCEVNLFREDENELVTLVSKTTQKVLFFQHDEQLMLHYQEGTKLLKEAVIFHELKLLNRKPYYVFRLLRDADVVSYMEPLSALFSTETEKGITSITEMHANQVTFVHNHPLHGREFELTFKENNQLRHFFGKAIWAKKVDNQYIYRLVSI